MLSAHPGGTSPTPVLSPTDSAECSISPVYSSIGIKQYQQYPNDIFTDMDINMIQRESSMGSAEISTQTTMMASFSAEVHHQQGGTCYANAIATVFRAIETKILARNVKSHQEYVDDILSRFGRDGARPKDVLKEECPKRQLRFRAINVNKVDEILLQHRPIIASFWLDTAQWTRFSSFFKHYPEKVIQATDIYASNMDIDDDMQTEGHTSVICGKTDKYWKIKNSWGDWADDGYFRVAKDALDLELYEVYVDVEDLRNNAKYSTVKAVARVINSANARIIGRGPPNDKYKEIEEECVPLIAHCSIEGILTTQCNKRQLRWNQVSYKEAREIVACQRPILGVLKMNISVWKNIVRCLKPSIISLEWNNKCIEVSGKKEYEMLIKDVSSTLDHFIVECPQSSDCVRALSMDVITPFEMAFYDVGFVVDDLLDEDLENLKSWRENVDRMDMVQVMMHGSFQ